MIREIDFIPNIGLAGGKKRKRNLGILLHSNAPSGWIRLNRC